MPKNSEPLKKYRDKRSAGATPEPFGGSRVGGNSRGGLFVVQKHAATRMHYDFRLEVGGVLKSWAVPKGPSYKVEDKHLAVFVEDHPIDYADFEGVIPDGNYGAGAVIVWDKGAFVPLEEFAESFEQAFANGKLMFELRGYKLRGLWQLVKIKKTAKEWLLIKKQDAFAGTSEPPENSVFSGLLVEELRGAEKKGAAVSAALAKAKAPVRELAAKDVELMLAEAKEKPFTSKEFFFELKYDGYRLLSERKGTRAGLFYRRGSDATAAFPEIARALSALPFKDFVFDGEVTVLDERGHPSFSLLQQRVQLRRPLDVQRAATKMPATYYVFDLLAFAGYDLRGLKLVERKALLRELLGNVGPVRFSDHIEAAGEAFFAKVTEMGIEGIVAKKKNSSYHGGRSDDWIKIRREQTADVVIVGYTRPEGSHTGALHLGVFDDRVLSYVGKVGSGFSGDELADIRRTLRPVKKPGFVGARPPGDNIWVVPEKVCEVRYLMRTQDGMLRHAIFLRLRDDKKAEDCAWQSHEAPAAAVLEPEEKIVPFSNLTKKFWPEYNKGDLIDYYRAISPWLLPYLRDRAVVLTRYPDGIDGKSFFQKDAPPFAPSWLRTEVMWSEQAQRQVHVFVAEDVESLLFLANLGTIPLHIWSSRIASLAQPDWCILDLDPKDAPFAHVIEVALVTHALCEEIGLDAFVKTTGSSGLHVLIPLARQLTHEQSKQLGELLARTIAERCPKIATVERMLGARKGRVYVDYLQNGHGKTVVAPFSVRPLPLAPVAMPLAWREVNKKLTPRKFTIAGAVKRMEKLGEDPNIGVLGAEPNLLAALEKLLAKMHE